MQPWQRRQRGRGQVGEGGGWAGGAAPSPDGCHGVSLTVAMSAARRLRTGGHIEHGAAVKEPLGAQLEADVVHLAEGVADHWEFFL